MLYNLAQTLKTSNSLIEFGTVESLDYVGEDGEPYVATETTDPEYSAKPTNEPQNLQFTGYLNVKLFNSNTVTKALYLMPLSSRSQMLGGLPERGAVCCLLKMKDAQGNTGARLVFGFMPIPVNLMITLRKELQNFKEGEINLQASAYDEATKDFYSGAQLHLDIYGRAIIESGDDDFRIVIGDLLSNEYTDNVAVVKDVITEEVICFQESYKKDRYSRSIDKDGNTIFRGVSALWDLLGDEIKRINGRYILTTMEQIRLEQGGNFLNISADGIVLSTSKKMSLTSIGETEINSGSYLALSSFLDLSMSTGASIVLKCLKEMLISAGGQMKLKTQDNLIVDAIKSITQTALMNIVLEGKITAKLQGGTTATVDATRVNLGSGAQPVAKGTTLQSDLIAHAHIDSLGFPTTPASAVTPNIFTTILSTKVNTE